MKRAAQFGIATVAGVVVVAIGLALKYTPDDSPEYTAAEDPPVARSDSITASPPATTPTSPPTDSGLTLSVVDAMSRAPVAAYEVAFLDYDPETDAAWRIAQNNPAVSWFEANEVNGVSRWAPNRVRDAEALGVRGPGYASGWAAIPSGADEVELELYPGAIADGQVVASSGEAIENAVVTIGKYETTTNTEGAFLIESLPGGATTVRAAHADYTSSELKSTLTPGRRHSFRIVLTAGGTIAGRVFERGVPVAGARIVAMEDVNVAAHRETQTGSEGSFKLSGLDAGEWRVMAALERADDTLRLHQLALVESGQETTVTFDFKAPAVVEGVISILDAPPAEATIQAHSVGSHDEQFTTAKANDAGFYAIDVMPGTVNLSVEAIDDSGLVRRRTAVVTVEEGVRQKDFKFGLPVRLTGQVNGVEDDETANVYVLPEDFAVDYRAPGWGVELPRRAVGHAVVDNEGRFRIDGLEEGRYTLVAVKFSTQPAPGASPLENLQAKEKSVNLAETTTHVEIAF